MSHEHHYEIELHDGRKFNVQTPRHHEQHNYDDWVAHVIDVIKGIAVNVGAEMIKTIIFKGRFPRR